MLRNLTQTPSGALGRPLRQGTAHLDAELDEALRARLAFFATATHDLRTPLTSLTLWMNTAALLNLRLAGSGDTQTVQLLDQALTHMQSLVRRSVHLVGDLLDMVRADAGHRLPFAPV
jgi:signal transduction histidine kinase